MNSYERELEYAGFSVIAGADEAGRGACAGPLVAAAVVWKECGVAAIDDSKKLTPAARAKSFELITANADDWACVSIPAPECDRLGIQTANISALRRALLKLRKTPDFALVDGFSIDGLPFPSLGIWKGDQVAKCVAAASILAKVTRDNLMIDLDQKYPEYGFAIHKGYVTPAHQAALERYGSCPEHRMSFVNVAGTR